MRLTTLAFGLCLALLSTLSTGCASLSSPEWEGRCPGHDMCLNPVTHRWENMGFWWNVRHLFTQPLPSLFSHPETDEEWIARRDAKWHAEFEHDRNHLPLPSGYQSLANEHGYPSPAMDEMKRRTLMECLDSKHFTECK